MAAAGPLFRGSVGGADLDGVAVPGNLEEPLMVSPSEGIGMRPTAGIPLGSGPTWARPGSACPARTTPTIPATTRRSMEILRPKSLGAWSTSRAAVVDRGDDPESPESITDS
jgi:hypothetical protein